MKSKGLLLIFVFLISIMLQAQVRKIALLEEATNASCAPCALNNPKLQDFFSNSFGGVISVRYHAWWPGSDPMYSANIPDNSDRINYYSVSGVPNYMIDGTNYGVPGNPDAMRDIMSKQISVTSPVKIVINKNVASDSVRAVIKIIGFGSVSSNQLYLRTAVIERLVKYSTAPGNNGEKEFEDVMRKLLPNSNGLSIPPIKLGDTLTYYVSAKTNASWVQKDIEMVSWLQDDVNKEIIQSNISLPTFIINSINPLYEFVGFNSTFDKEYNIKNENAVPIKIRLKIDSAVLPSDWSYSFIYNGNAFDSTDITIQPDETINFQLKVITGSQKGTASIKIKAVSLDDPYGYGYSTTYTGIAASGNILLVDADGGTDGHLAYQNALINSRRDFTVVNQSAVSSLLTNILTSDFSTVIWANGWAFPAFTNSDLVFLTSFLSNHRNLFIAGQDIGWDIFDAQGSSNFQNAKDFYHNNLDANYVSDDAGIASATGITGTLGEGLSFSVNAISGNRYPEVLRSYSGKSDSVFFYTNSTKVAALAFDQGNFKAFYLGVGLEQVSSSAIRDSIMSRVLNWFGEPVSDIENISAELPQTFYLMQNYPNPFNPSTLIRYSVISPTFVSLKVYDILGKEVKTLVQQQQAGGVYEVNWNGDDMAGNNVSTGVYFYKIKAGDYSETKKMILLR